MATYGYIVDIQAKLGNLQAATAQIAAFAGKFTSLNDAVRTNQTLQDSITKVRKHTEGLSGSIESLENAKDMLFKQRHILPPEAINEIRAINLEVSHLDNKINRLTMANGTQLSTALSSIGNSIPGIELLSNPIALVGGALAKATYDAAIYEKEMAKVNTTAELSSEGLTALGDRLKNYGLEAGYADLKKVPDAYNRILGATNDVAASEDILRVALKGAAAGFADVDVVGDALSKTMGAIGMNSGYTASQIGNILFAAKRVGAGELQDFAQNIPALISSSHELGFTLEEVSGTFAYFTAKGNDASRSTMLMQNLFTLFNKADVISGFSKMGVAVEDANGKTRGLKDIVGDLQEKLQGKSIGERANILKQMGLNDAQANQAISVLISDTDKLSSVLGAMNKDVDEIGKSFGNSEHTMREFARLAGTVSNVALKLGSYILPAVNYGVIGLRKVFEVLNPLVDALIVPLGYLAVTLLVQNWAAISTAISNSALALSIKSVGTALMAVPGPGLLLAIAGGIAYAAMHSEELRKKIGTLIDKFWYLALPLSIALGLFIGIKIQAAYAAASAALSAVGFGVAGVGGWTMAAGLFQAALSLQVLTAAIYNIPIIGWVLAAVAAIGVMLIAWTDFRIAVMSVLDVLWNCLKLIKYIFTGNWMAAFSLNFDVTKNFKERKAAEGLKEAEKKKTTDAATASTNSPDALANKDMINDAVKDSTGGGTRATQVTFTLGSVVETLNIVSDGFDTAAEDMEARITEHLFRAFSKAMIGTTR